MGPAFFPAADHAFEALGNSVHPVRVASKRFREGLQIGDGVAQRFGIFHQDIVEPAQRLARGLHHVLTGRGIGDEKRRLRSALRQGRRRRSPP
jgi:hypothetical protein